jgi:hypothetical protein
MAGWVLPSLASGYCCQVPAALSLPQLNWPIIYHTYEQRAYYPHKSIQKHNWQRREAQGILFNTCSANEPLLLNQLEKNVPDLTTVSVGFLQ